MNGSVWIIDDDQSIRDAIQMLLDSENYTAVMIDNPRDIKKLLTENKPAIVFLDYHMDGFTGKDIIEQLKNYEELKETPIIIMTADMDIEKKAKEVNATAYLKKPFEIDTFLNLIKNHTADNAL